MRIITKKIYDFDELDQRAKEYAKNKYYEDCGLEDNSNDFNESANELLKLIGFRNSKVSYSLGYCQGDGLTYSFNLYSSEIIDILNICKNNRPAEKGYKLLEDIHDNLFNIVKDFFIDENFIIKNDIAVYTFNINSHYCHKYTKSIVVTNEENSYAKTLQKIFEDIYYAVCDFLENMGYNWIYTKMTDEEFSELSRCNYWEYYEDGTLY